MIQPPKSLFLPNGKRAVLLLHAYSGSPNDVRMMARYLEKWNYTVYVPLYSGHGTMDPLDILENSAEQWWEDTQNGVAYLKSKGYQEIAVFGLSMGGVFATRLLSKMPENFLGGGFFCSPIAPVKTNVTENFLLYAKQVLDRSGKEATREKIDSYRPLVEDQLKAIEDQALIAYENLAAITRPFFMAQAGQDEMIEAEGVFQTASQLRQTSFSLNWYPESSHVITVGPERRQLEQDVVNFLASLGWREDNGEKNN